jgi:hypothetical protein
MKFWTKLQASSQIANDFGDKLKTKLIVLNLFI